MICFATTSRVDKETITHFFWEELRIGTSKDIIVLDDYYEYLMNEKPNTEKVYFRYSIETGEFDVWVEISHKNIEDLDMDKMVTLLLKLSKATNTHILIGSEGVDPFNFILIEPNEECSSIDIDYTSFNERDELNFGHYDNPFFGQFALKKEIEINNLKTEIATLFKDYFTDFEIQFGYSGPVVNGDFDKNKLHIKELEDFKFHYDIIPKGKQRWFSIQRKSKIFTDILVDFSRDNNIDVCIFPANYSVVENIEGGSDSEQHCIISKRGATQKIIYKTRRNSWKTKEETDNSSPKTERKWWYFFGGIILFLGLRCIFGILKGRRFS